jgi:tetratricopeptide (TPR) repeat protein
MNCAARIILVALICLVPLYVYSDEKPPSIYTVQIASFGDLESAQKKFHRIADKLESHIRDYLRIERVGKYFPLRLGLFKSRMEALAFLQSVKPTIPSAIVVKSIFVDERIKQMYRARTEIEEKKRVKAPSPRAGNIKPRQESITKVAVEKETEKAPVIMKSNSVRRDIPKEEKIATINSLLHNKNYGSALEILKNEIIERPQHPELNALYGTALLRTDRPEEAHQYLKKAAELSPSTPGYHNGLGYCYFYLDDYDKAIESFNKTVSLEPDQVDALAGLGIVYVRKGNKKASLEYYSRLKKLDANSAGKLLKIIELTK